MSHRVLIVEDNELNMKLFHDLLEAHGMTILMVRNGIDALTVAKRERPDLIVMDIQLPEMSGLEVNRAHQVGSRPKTHPRDRRHRVRHEGGRGAHPRRRLRGLPVEADLNRQVHLDGEVVPAAPLNAPRRAT